MLGWPNAGRTIPTTPPPEEEIRRSLRTRSPFRHRASQFAHVARTCHPADRGRDVARAHFAFSYPLVWPNHSNKSTLPFEPGFEEILRHILPRVFAEAFARGLVECQDRQHVRKGKHVFAPCWEWATPSSVDVAVVAIVHHHVGPVLAVGGAREPVPEPLAVDVTSLDAKAVVETSRLRISTLWVFEHDVRRSLGIGHHAHCPFHVGCSCEWPVGVILENEREAAQHVCPLVSDGRQYYAASRGERACYGALLEGIQRRRSSLPRSDGGICYRPSVSASQNSSGPDTEL